MAKKNSFYKLEMLLLSVLSVQDCYGYELTKIIKTESGGRIDIKEGTMYPILYKLVEENLISSYDKIVGKKIRVYYKIEESGRQYLKESIDDFNDFIMGINSVLNMKRKEEISDEEK